VLNSSRNPGSFTRRRWLQAKGGEDVKSPLDYLGDGSHNVVELFNNPGSCHVNRQFQRA
jgi:hypothetical protein